VQSVSEGLDVGSGGADAGPATGSGGSAGDPAEDFFRADARAQGLPYYDPKAPIDYVRKYGILPPNHVNVARKHEVNVDRFEGRFHAPLERV
jgi:hypothetical protein